MTAGGLVVGAPKEPPRRSGGPGTPLRIICPTYWYPQHASDTQATYVHDINRHLVRRGHSVTVVTPVADTVETVAAPVTGAEGTVVAPVADRWAIIVHLRALQTRRVLERPLPWPRRNRVQARAPMPPAPAEPLKRDEVEPREDTGAPQHRREDSAGPAGLDGEVFREHAWIATQVGDP